jgi:hypothetical protein
MISEYGTRRCMDNLRTYLVAVIVPLSMLYCLVATTKHAQQSVPWFGPHITLNRATQTATYINTKYGFTFHYPGTMSVDQCASGAYPNEHIFFQYAQASSCDKNTIFNPIGIAMRVDYGTTTTYPSVGSAQLEHFELVAANTVTIDGATFRHTVRQRIDTRLASSIMANYVADLVFFDEGRRALIQFSAYSPDAEADLQRMLSTFVFTTN